MRKNIHTQSRKRTGKSAAVLILTALILTLSLTVFVFGADLSEMIRVYRNNVILEVNDVRIPTDNFLYNGTTYVPIRVIAHALGKQVGWNSTTRVASIYDSNYQKAALSRLLPSQPGFEWMYSGFAEYSHEMTLGSIVDEPQKRTYYISGMVGDPSGGESTADLSLLMKYIIEENRLIQEKTEEAMLDSKYVSLILIKTPLVVGNYWSQTVTEKTGAVTRITSQITDVKYSDAGSRQFVVLYSDNNSPYYEQRIIQEGTGIVSFEKLLELTGDSFPAGYTLNEFQNQKYMEIKLYFPDSNADKVWLETRDVMVYNDGTARAAVEALISGPVSEGQSPSIPQDTALKNISILNGICTVDFSKEFIDNHWGGSAGEMMTLASIVNTLTEFASIQKVMILVEGKAGATLGNILLDHALERMSDMIGQ